MLEDTNQLLLGQTAAIDRGLKSVQATALILKRTHELYKVHCHLSPVSCGEWALTEMAFRVQVPTQPRDSTDF